MKQYNFPSLLDILGRNYADQIQIHANSKPRVNVCFVHVLSVRMWDVAASVFVMRCSEAGTIICVLIAGDCMWLRLASNFVDARITEQRNVHFCEGVIITTCG